MNGYFITLEGIEGSGKTTQVPSLTECIHELGYDVLVTREPGGSELAEKIRAILLDPGSSALVPLAELFLYLADRAQHVQEVIRPALKAGQVVLCDRYADATVAYQGHARGLGAEMVAELNRYATGGLEPDLTLLFDLPVEIGLARAKERIDRLESGAPTEDRFEQEAMDFHQRVRDGYLALAGANPIRYEIIDASRTPEQIEQSIRYVTEARLVPRSSR